MLMKAQHDAQAAANPLRPHGAPPVGLSPWKDVNNYPNDIDAIFLNTYVHNKPTHLLLKTAKYAVGGPVHFVITFLRKMNQDRLSVMKLFSGQPGFKENYLCWQKIARKDPLTLKLTSIKNQTNAVDNAMINIKSSKSVIANTLIDLAKHTYPSSGALLFYANLKRDVEDKLVLATATLQATTALIDTYNAAHEKQAREMAVASLSSSNSERKSAGSKSAPGGPSPISSPEQGS